MGVVEEGRVGVAEWLRPTNRGRALKCNRAPWLC